MATGEFAQHGGTGLPRAHLLVVEDDDDYAFLVARMLDDNHELAVTHERASTLAAARDALEDGDHDLVLLDLQLPDSDGLRTLRRLRDVSPDTAVVVLTGVEDPDVALRVITVGAEEYLAKNEISPILLSKVIRYALERWRLRHELVEARETANRERELRQLEAMTGERTDGAGPKGSAGPLAAREPERYDELRAAYEQMLAEGLHERDYRTRGTTATDVRSLARLLGVLEATPRDVIDLHAAALGRSLQSTDGLAHQALVEESRLRVLQLMGHLASYYRIRALGTDPDHEPPSSLSA